MVPDRTSSRVAIAVLLTVALAFASACAHRRAAGLRVSSTSIVRSVSPGIERGSALKRHDDPSMKPNERASESVKGDSRDETSAGMPSVFANPPSGHGRGAASFGSSVVITPRPVPEPPASASRGAGHSTSPNRDASTHPVLAAILLAVLLVAGWVLARAIFDRRVAS
jgi:hypothetical protein